MNVQGQLAKLKVDTSSVVIATSEVGEMMRSSPNPLQLASRFFDEVLLANIRFEEDIFARMAVKKMVALVIDSGMEVDDAEPIITQSLDYAKEYCDNPDHSYMWSKADDDSNEVVSGVAVATGIETKVALKSDGKIKKGGKSVLCEEMYKKFVVEAEQPLSTKEFMALLIKELDMTTPGARTYLYNMKKKFSS